MGKSVQKISDSVSLIASENTWIEGLAIEQLIKTSQLDGMLHVSGMPDLHPGRGYPVGAAFFTDNKVYPALVGNDIGCGMSLWQSSAKVNKVNLDKYAKKLKHIEDPLGDTWLDLIARRKREKVIKASGFDRSLGTIGGGNHFAEFQKVDEIHDHDHFDALGLNQKQLLLLVHSGSRGLGQAILTDHISEHNHAGLSKGSAAFNSYLENHDDAVKWAELNRELIALRFFDALNENGHCLLDVNHNLVTQKRIGNQDGWLHRKGATPADLGYVVIPGSRGDFSYLVTSSSSNNSSLESSLYSLAHGAGRKWKRGDCQERLSHKYKKDDLLKTALGSKVICGSKELLYDEAPQAYKNCESIIQDLVAAELITVVARLRPVLTFKTNGDCSS